MYEICKIKSYGWAVLDTEVKQWMSVHIFETREEAQVVRDRHEEAWQINANWPEPDDPDVLALLNDVAFEPIGQTNVDVLTSPVYRLRQAAEAVARRRAGIN